MTNAQALQAVFSRNRAEEIGQDVWREFVVPPFYDRLDLQTARKPRLIIGGRGCGKTMLLYYLCHNTQFSPHRPTVPAGATSHIGLYWRVDTHFMNLMAGRGKPDDSWHSVFLHMAAVVLSMEVLASLKSVANSGCPALDVDTIGKLNFKKLRAFDPDLPSSLEELRDALRARLWELQAWVNDTRKAVEPRFLPGEKFVQALISETRAQIPALVGANYFVYIDESENLCTYQKKIINAWLKHSEAPLIFNLAMKRNAFDTQATTGPESLSNIHDYRIHDLEAYVETDFPAFAAEILFLQLSLAEQPVPVDPAALRDPECLSDRRDPRYLDRVRSAARDLLPGLSHEDLAQGVFEDSAVSSKLRERITKVLRKHGTDLPLETFYRADLAEASIVVPALLYRPGIQPEFVKLELDKLALCLPNDFTGARNWIHNNFIGSYLQLYEPLSRPCPFYAGFQAFCYLAHGNIRYFLELCHKSLGQRDPTDDDSAARPVQPMLQAEAAREVSAAFLGEVKSFGPRGLQLHTFVLRLGSLFAMAHQRPSQSEPEPTHFSIGSGMQILTDDDWSFLREAGKWSVLFEEEETKKKDESEQEDTEYVLAPIYAPYFHISYRKRRKLKLTTDEVVVLIRGTYAEMSKLLRRYSANWSVDPDDLTPTLFSHLKQG